MIKFQINSSDMIKLRVCSVALGVMCHVYNYNIKLQCRPPEDEQGNARNM
jgi:hypothetical protein